MFSKNVTIDHLGKITILLGDYFSFPNNFKKLFNDGDSELKSNFKISMIFNQFHKLDYSIEMVSYTTSKKLGIKRGKTIKESSIKELVGSTVEEFK